MKLSDLINKYEEIVTEIQLYQRAIKRNTTKELKELNDYAKFLEEKPDLKDVSSSIDNMYFHDVRNGEMQLFGQKICSVEDRTKNIILHKNRQYQWLLAEAYEAFEDYIKKAYAFAGYIDKDFWPLKDFGNISLTELYKKDFDWFLIQAESKRDAPQSILNQFRLKFPSIVEIEKNNALKINLKLTVILIEQLRHIIVHNRGTTFKKEKFIEIVLKKAGLFNNGKYVKENYDFIASFFGGNEYTNNIVLLEVPKTAPEFPFKIETCIFQTLSGNLLAYAHLIHESLQLHQEQINA